MPTGLFAAESRLSRKRAYFTEDETVAGTFHVRVADVSPETGDAHARSVVLSKVPLASKSIHPHKVAAASTPVSATGAENVPPGVKETEPANAVVPSSIVVMFAPAANASTFVAGFIVPV